MKNNALKIFPTSAFAKTRHYMSFPITGSAPSNKTDKLDAIYVPTNLLRHRGPVDFYKCLTNFSHRVLLVTDIESAYNARGAARVLVDVSELLPSSFHEHHIRLLASASGSNPSRMFLNTYNLPAKRNLAIEHAREQGYDAIMLLDDDIFIESSTFWRGISLLKNCAQMVGFYVLDYPDVSTTDHLYRIANNKRSSVSVAANCIMMRPHDVTGFFPYIYNEDWLFLYAANAKLTKIAAGLANQLYYEPWHQQNRVEFEQFGEVVANGIKRNLKSGREALDGTPEFWSSALGQQAVLLEGLAEAGNLDESQTAAVVRAITALKKIDARSVADFARSYTDDLNLWGD